MAILMVIVPLVISSAANAAAVTYDGTGMLQTTPGWFDGGIGDALFPGTETDPLFSDNGVIVNYPAVSGVTTDPVFVFGGLSQLENAANNEVKLIDGYVGLRIFGGWSYSGNASNNSVDISGGNVSWDVCENSYELHLLSCQNNLSLLL